MSDCIKNVFIVPDDMVGQRIDKAIALYLQTYSRSTVQSWMKQGLVLLDGETPRPKDKVMGGENVELVIPQTINTEFVAQDMQLDVIYSDESVIVINKSAGLVVHPGAGNHDGTLLNGILFHYPDNKQLPRAGIVHRLDKDTSGLMVVARTEQARLHLIEQLVDHSLYREYIALVAGRIISGASVEEAISRDSNDRRKMTVNPLGKEAITHYRVEQRYRNHTLLKVQLETGRTHQIRVHMTHLGFPLVGDPVYGRRLAIPVDCSEGLEQSLRTFHRQALHARKIGFVHPETQEEVTFESPLPEDMRLLIQVCQQDYER